ncbi:probable polyamine oxidase 5 [Hyposmocoma kahamanoa]|uniref:probable polyamine oxidase 5 n=1 Tax=Hyposmocoma kahamanoa TaxID=1477025 RepID=UPI000E6D6CD9|nr:probable polyamine oxidase 5 [Hyposmocoma kahamanoa]
MSAPTPQPYDTIVIGLGSAGTTAASTLAQAGKRVLALEAQDRIGGRVNTVPFGDGLVEVGAEWIHGTQPSRVYDLAIANHVTLIPQELEFEVYRSDGTTADTELVKELLMYCIEVIETPPDKPEALGHFITRKLNDYLKEKHPDVPQNKEFIDSFLAFMNLLINNYEAANDWNDVSAYTKYEDLGGHQHMSWHRYGYKTFFDILLNKYNNGPGLPTLEIKLNTEVTKIIWPQDPKESVAVTTKDGTIYTANNVIVTVSLGVLKERHLTLFQPRLPPKNIAAIDFISMGVIDKIIISFKEAWWLRTISFYAFIWTKDELGQVGRDDTWITKIFGASTPRGSNNTLTLWTNGDMAKLVETLPEEVVKRKVVELLRRFMGHKYTIPEPTGMIRSTWFTNPFTRGSYTYDNLDVSKHPTARADLGAPLLDSAMKPRVLFAGEATNEIHFSTVHGASETGYREAMRLLPTDSKI